MGADLGLRRKRKEKRCKQKCKKEEQKFLTEVIEVYRLLKSLWGIVDEFYRVANVTNFSEEVGI